MDSRQQYTNDSLVALNGGTNGYSSDYEKSRTRNRRSSDGQVAYWGPSGVAFKPHWYAKPGRPSEMSGGKKVNTYLDAESIAIATKLGNGNVSDGIRKALKQAV